MTEISCCLPEDREWLKQVEAERGGDPVIDKLLHYIEYRIWDRDNYREKICQMLGVPADCNSLAELTKRLKE